MNSLNITSIFILLASMNQINAELNSFGLSTIIPERDKSFSVSDQEFLDRISEEMGSNLTIEKIMDFLRKIQANINFLMNKNNITKADKEIIMLAIIDVTKAKKELRPDETNPESLARLRRIIRELDEQALKL